MNQLASAVTFLLGILVGGALADGGFGDFLAIVGGCVGVGAGAGALAAWLLSYEPAWDRGIGYGSIIGLAWGLVLAVVDLAAGG